MNKYSNLQVQIIVPVQFSLSKWKKNVTVPLKINKCLSNKIIRRDREANTIGGGCWFYITNHICSTQLSSLDSPDIEAIWLGILVKSSVFIVRNFIDHPQILYSLIDFWIKCRNVVIIGNLNCDGTHLTDSSISSTSGQKLLDLFFQFDYMVINDKPTTVTSDTSTLIDLVISSKCNLIKSTRP